MVKVILFILFLTPDGSPQAIALPFESMGGCLDKMAEINDKAKPAAMACTSVA